VDQNKAWVDIRMRSIFWVWAKKRFGNIAKTHKKSYTCRCLTLFYSIFTLDPVSIKCPFKFSSTPTRDDLIRPYTWQLILYVSVFQPSFRGTQNFPSVYLALYEYRVCQWMCSSIWYDFLFRFVYHIISTLEFTSMVNRFELKICHFKLVYPYYVRLLLLFVWPFGCLYFICWMNQVEESILTWLRRQ